MASWYSNSRSGFLTDGIDLIVSRLHESAANDGWHIEPDQDIEWRASIEAMKANLEHLDLENIDGVLAEYDFRRRGLRMDFILVASGALFVVEFKRGIPSKADRDQVTNYCINLVEFHDLTQQLHPLIFPVIVSRKRDIQPIAVRTSWHDDWPNICRPEICCSTVSLGSVLRDSLKLVPRDATPISYRDWDSSPFHPSSSIIDATLSLYGQHEVSAIRAHAVPKADIDNCVSSVISEIDAATQAGRHEIIIVSGAPGSGKTLVGLAVTFHPRYRNEAVFVTGNAPLVDVLNGSLQRSYMQIRRQGRSRALAGYTRRGVGFVERNADFKIVKAHRFLEHTRGTSPSSSDNSSDGRILVFDEAQRTYSEGKLVNRKRLDKDEAVLILEEMTRRPKSIIVLLLGHNQHINMDEMGAAAWLKAARVHGWRFAVSDQSLALEEFSQGDGWSGDPLRISISHTHLSHSLRDQRTRNGEIEKWADCVMTNNPDAASRIALSLPDRSVIHLTRSIESARRWARKRCSGEDRCGIIASGQGHRLRPEGVFVAEKPDIVPWMLEPGDDVRSSNMLEQTQNQYQIQGLEIDYAITCWDADLRRENGNWAAYKVLGAGWAKAVNEVDTRSNSYRVLLTRSRKGMTIFVPTGDRSGADRTRPTAFYDDIADYLIRCGAVPMGGGNIATQ